MTEIKRRSDIVTTYVWVNRQIEKLQKMDPDETHPKVQETKRVFEEVADRIAERPSFKEAVYHLDR